MTPAFRIVTTPRFERSFNKLARHHPQLRALPVRVGEILSSDPYNRTRFHNIRKLESVPPGEGQYRLRLSRFRFRYDIEGQLVMLKVCSLRSEATYR